MRVLRAAAFLAILAWTPVPAGAQRAGTLELGAFGHFTKLDKDVQLGDNSFGAGGRVGFFALRQLSLEAEYSYGTLSDNVRAATAWYPFRGFVVLNLPLSSRVKLLAGVGFKHDIWKGDTTFNQYEDAITALGGLRVCLKNNWSLRPEVVFDKNPSPNFQQSLTATSSHLGFRIGLSKFFGRGRETCAGLNQVAAVQPPPPSRAAPPAAGAPPPPPPPPRPTATLSAAPTAITAGQATTLRWSSANATNCSAPWMAGGAGGGSQSVSPTTTTTYTVTCTGAGGSVATSTTVTVTQPAPPPPPPPPPPAAAPPPREIYRLDGVFFDFDRSTLKPEGRVRLDDAVAVLSRIPDLRVEIQGYTDSRGADEYNNRLSMHRADAVRAYLVSKGIGVSRLTTRGFGESQPVATNDTDEGRAQNRRVMLIEIRN